MAAGEKKNIALKTHGCDRSVVIQGDRQLLTRALINIIDNAIKFTVAGTDVDFQLNVKGKNVTISVCDRGPGIRESILSERFSTSSSEGQFVRPMVPDWGWRLFSQWRSVIAEQLPIRQGQAVVPASISPCH